MVVVGLESVCAARFYVCEFLGVPAAEGRLEEQCAEPRVWKGGEQ